MLMFVFQNIENNKKKQTRISFDDLVLTPIHELLSMGPYNIVK